MTVTSGKTVRLFLVDGSPMGLITAEIMNWSGHVLVIPRSQARNGMTDSAMRAHGLARP